MADLETLRADQNTVQEALSPSVKLRKQGNSLMISIIFFLITYSLVMAFALGLAIGFGYFGVILLKADLGILSPLFGGGLITIGFSILYFIAKFVFSVSKDENPLRMEVKETDEPKLFAFLKEIAAETRTRFPKKVFISADVNAKVFYNSSFWSMFFPVRKNLEIGLGLVNSINRSEFKAIMAHEFAHFSQRSMRLGSFTYNVNRVMNDLLYNNTDYEEFLKRWGKLHGVLAFCAGMTVRISQMIQWALRRTHQILNNNYFELSRQTEFEADRIAAKVAGSNNLISGLAKVKLATECYTEVIRHISDFAKGQKASRNIFSNQHSLFRFMGTQYRLPVVDGLPEVSYQFIQSVSTSRIQYDDHHSSHPTIKERKENLDALKINKPTATESAWSLFTHPTDVEERMTANLYRLSFEQELREIFDQHFYENWLNEKKEKSNLPSPYNGFYDNRFVTLTGEQIKNASLSFGSKKTFRQLFSEQNAGIQPAIMALESDMKILLAIQHGQIEADQFRFEGKLYRRSECTTVIRLIQQRAKELLQRQRSLDQEAYSFFYYHSTDPDKLEESYMHYYTVSEKYAGYLEHFWAAMEIINKFSAGITVEQALSEAARLQQIDQQVLKGIFAEIIEQGPVTLESNQELFERIEAFQSKKYQYFFDESFLQHEVSELHNLLLHIAAEINRDKVNIHKEMLREQLAGLKDMSGVYVGQ
jgi:Zn-dependent protease with chaperone function